MKPLLLILLAFVSCTVPDKASLKVLRETRKSRSSPVTLKAYKSGKKTVDQLELRENNSFFYQSRIAGSQKSVIYAGTFTKKNDTLFLSFHDNHKDSLWTGLAIVDTINKEITLLTKNADYNIQLPIVKQN